MYPANTRRSPNVVTMLAHRLRRWANIVTTLGERLTFHGISAKLDTFIPIVLVTSLMVSHGQPWIMCVVKSASPPPL